MTDLTLLLEQGLSDEEVEHKRLECGWNHLPEAKPKSLLRLFFTQFTSPFIYILFVAAIVSYFVNQPQSTVFILAVLLLNAVIGTIQENSAQKSAQALKDMVKGQARVIRGGQAIRIEAEQLVPGDVVLLTSGDKVPADIRLYFTQDLAVDESMLTGESMAVTKNSDAVVSEDATLSLRFNEAFAGSVVTHGRGQGIVSQIGVNTQIGAIADKILGEEETTAPLMVRIQKFTYQMAFVIIGAILLLIGLMVLVGGYQAEGMLMMAIGLAVSVIPEGLPAALTVALAMGMRRMAEHNVIIRKLVAVEALGSCTYICTDKTGTLTVNELTIRQILLPNGERFNVTGEGVAEGHVEVNNEDARELLEMIAVTGVLANESYLEYAGGEWVSDGDIVDVSFLVLAKKLGLSLSSIREQRQQIELIPYESEKALSASLNCHQESAQLHIKGSPEKILAMSSQMMTDNGIVPINEHLVRSQFEGLASEGFRVIALGLRYAQSSDAESQLNDVTFIGMVGMIDPVRQDAKAAVERCRSGGIEVAMLTGDHPLTARAIGTELSLCQPEDAVVTGTMLREAEQRGESSLRDLVLATRVFARIEPAQKQLIVKTLMREGHFVAVTGDGVNDAPAMKQAHVGVAMGLNGTDVAKETADLILTDDKFSSIVDGIEQGRVVYNNIRKVIGLLVATGFSAILLFMLTVLAGLPMPLTAIQLLWLNLVANGLQDVALAFEPKEGHELKQTPRHPKEPIFDKGLIEHVLIHGAVMGGLVFAFYYSMISSDMVHEEARNLTLMLMIIFGNVHAFTCRSEHRSVFEVPLKTNLFLMVAIPLAQAVHIGASHIPLLSDVLDISPIAWADWLMLVAITMILLIVSEVHKYWTRHRLGYA